MLTVGSLFAGIGGFDLGFERTGGFRTAWFCEQDEFCQRVIAKHWPDAPCYPDVCRVKSREQFEAHGFGQPVARVDVLCGGFPCQDISVAGDGAGLAGARSGLWSEYARLIGELRPRYVVVENVSALLARGLGTVLGDLAALGYDAEWDCIPASALGAPHRRDRFWLVAYPTSERRGPWRQGRPPASHPWQPQPERPLQVPDAAGARLEGRQQPSAARGLRSDPAGRDSAGARPWANEPSIPRVVDGLPDWVDRMRATGNALVPQVAEWIGRRILDYEESCVTA